MSQPDSLSPDTRPNSTQSSGSTSTDARPRSVDGNTAQNLGARLQIYRNKPLPLWKLLVFGILGACAILFPLLYGSWRAFQALTSYGPAALLNWSSVWFMLALAALLVFAFLCALLLRTSSTTVAIYKGGVVIHQGFTRTTRLAWKQLSGVSTELVEENFLGRRVKSYQHSWLYPNLGHPLRLPDSIEGLPELTSQIKASLYRRLLPGLRQNFSDGKWLFFGPVGIHLSALRLKDQTNPWKDIRQIRIQDGFLEIVAMQGAVNTVPLAKIPNVELLLQLVQEDVKV